MSNIISYFGRGVNFNGIDQEAQYAEKLPTTGDITMMFTGRGTVSCLFKNLWINNNTIQYWSSEFSFEVKHIPDRTNNDTYALVILNNELKWYINGVLNSIYKLYVSVDSTNAQNYIGGRNGLYYDSGILRNVIMVQKILTATQIKQQFEEPEKFLYREDEVLKSEFLEQEDIDAVKAYLPMCEVDGYVRNLAGYNEGENEIINGTFDADTTNWDTNNSGATITWQDGGTAICSNTDDWSYVFQWHSEWEIGDTFVVEFDILSIDATLRIGVDAGSVLSSVGHYTVTNTVTNNTRFTIAPTTSGTYNVEIDNISVKKLTSTYPIANPTSTLRDDAKNLSYGLQTSKWKRDVLGVPYASSFDRLECDGSGYVDTGWVPELGIGKEYSIELIMYIKTYDAIGNYDYKGVGIHNINCIRQFNYASGSLSVSIESNYFNAYGVLRNQDFFHHIAVSVSKNSFTTYLDGSSLGTTDIINTSTDSASYPIGKILNDLDSELATPLRLFKVHQKAMTPQEVEFRYNELVDKGLLA